MILMWDIGAKAVGILRTIALTFDSAGFSCIDTAYDIMIMAMKGFNQEAIKEIAGNLTKSSYVLVGVFALFRIAIMLVNSIINPDKLTDKKEGAGNVLVHFVGTIALLVLVPLVFDMSRELQNTIMEGNYISKFIIGTEIASGSSSKAGEMVQRITVKSMIKPDDRIATINSSTGNYEINENAKNICGTECDSVITHWNENRVRFTTLTNDINAYVQNGDETIYVYSYTPFITLIVGIFMTYVLVSFTIDIAIRSVELLVLEVLSPLFIVTFMDPKMASSGPFKKWLSASGKSYVSLFIRVAVVSLMLLLLSNLDKLLSAGVFNAENGWFMKLFMILAILMFAKKAPKWLGDMIGVSDGAGLGGLGIGKKLATAALVGGALTKASRGIAGTLRASSGNVSNAIRNRMQEKKQAYQEAGIGSGKERRSYRKNLRGENGEELTTSQRRKMMKQKKQEALDKARDSGTISGNLGKQAFAGALSGILSFSNAAKADSLSSALNSGKTSASDFKSKHHLSGNTMRERISDGITDKLDAFSTGSFGGGTNQFERKKRLEDMEQFQSSIDSKKCHLQVGDMPLGEKGAVNAFAGSTNPVNDQYAAAALMNSIRSNPAYQNAKLSIDCSDGKTIKVTAEDHDGNKHLFKVDRESDTYTTLTAEGKTYFKEEGAARVNDNAVALQQAAVNNVAGANTKINELAQANNVAQQNIAYYKQMVQTAQTMMQSSETAMVNALRGAFNKLSPDILSGINLGGVDINKAGLKELQNIMAEGVRQGVTLDKGNYDSEKVKYDEAEGKFNNANKDYHTNYDTNMNIITNNNEAINAYQAYKEKWAHTEETTHKFGSTIEEITGVLEKNRKKTSSILETYKDEKKKESK